MRNLVKAEITKTEVCTIRTWAYGIHTVPTQLSPQCHRCYFPNIPHLDSDVTNLPITTTTTSTSTSNNHHPISKILINKMKKKDVSY
jgi:hypothetical protein